MGLPGIAAIALCSLLSLAQQVQVSSGKGDVVLTIQALKPYQLVVGEEKTPTLSVECVQKGKKSAHLVKFSAGGTLGQDSIDAPAQGSNPVLNVTIGNGPKHATTWAPYGDAVTFVYLGKTEAERIAFLQTLLNAPTVSIEFKPFLTGTTITSVFDISSLREEVDKHPECRMP